MKAVNSLAEVRISLQRLDAFLSTPEPPLPAAREVLDGCKGSSSDDGAAAEELQSGLAGQGRARRKSGSRQQPDGGSGVGMDKAIFFPSPAEPPVSLSSSDLPHSLHGTPPPSSTYREPFTIKAEKGNGKGGGGGEERGPGYVALRGVDFSWDFPLGLKGLHQPQAPSLRIKDAAVGHMSLSLSRADPSGPSLSAVASRAALSQIGRGAASRHMAVTASSRPAAAGGVGGSLKRNMSLFSSFRGIRLRSEGPVSLPSSHSAAPQLASENKGGQKSDLTFGRMIRLESVGDGGLGGEAAMKDVTRRVAGGALTTSFRGGDAASMMGQRTLRGMMLEVQPGELIGITGEVNVWGMGALDNCGLCVAQTLTLPNIISHSVTQIQSLS